MSRDAYRKYFFVLILCMPDSSLLADKYYFDEKLLQGTSLSQEDIKLLTKGGAFLPGVYSLDLVVNGVFVSRENISLVGGAGEEVEPCLDENLLVKKVGVKAKSDFLLDNPREGGSSLSAGLLVGEAEKIEDGCHKLSSRLPSARFELDSSKLKLNLTIPHGDLDTKPIGYISPSEWDAGELMGFLSYDASYYRSENKSGGSFKTNFGFLSMNAGFNLGLWRVRHVSSLSYRKFASDTGVEWNNLRTYVQRSIPEISSELTIGDLYTNSSMFSGVSYRGLSVSTDERMLPYSRINYAPEVRGVANTTARVVISQNSRVIRELTVPPGTFVIDDLYDTASAGDLEVRVVEADGSISEFTVPYAAVPQSIRPGNSRYSIDFGKLRDYAGDTYFADLVYERGLTNLVTASGGLRVAKDYVAVAGGGVLATQLGAFGMNAVFSHADDIDGKRQQGWRFGINYSKTFQDTNTNVSLAGYRYSTRGFRELSDIASVRDAVESGVNWNSYTYQQRNQVVLSVSQSLGEYGSVYISGSASDYYDGKSKNTNVQVGYANNWRGISYNIALSRQNSYFYNDYLGVDLATGSPLQEYNSKPYNSIVFSFSVPLGSSARSPSLNSYVTRTMGEYKNTVAQTGVSGSLLDDGSLSYSLGLGKDQGLDQTTFTSSVSKLSQYARISGGFVRGSNYDQYNASVSGSVVAHSGGLTFGQYLGDTFALVEVPGGGGSILKTGTGVRVNESGYAIMSNLAPYRYNSIIVQPGDIAYTAELVETEQKVVPYAGASLRVKFNTVKGYPLLIIASYPDGTPLQMGVSVFNENNVSVGVVGQGGQVYARVEGMDGVLKVGQSPEDVSVCHIKYRFTQEDLSDNELNIIRRRGVCEFPEFRGLNSSNSGGGF